MTVDDEEATLRLLTQWLIPLDYDIALAFNGQEAAQKTRESRLDLIILDIMMPVMDGYYDALRCQRPYKAAFDHQRTFKIITEGDGRAMQEHFDPAVLKVFKETVPLFEEIFERHQ
ncbi:MAG: response regulator [Dissulfurispiraceae bacterium]